MRRTKEEIEKIRQNIINYVRFCQKKEGYTPLANEIAESLDYTERIVRHNIKELIYDRRLYRGKGKRLIIEDAKE